MDDLQFDDLEFPLAWCVPCGREVLTAAGGDAGRRQCVHCAAAVEGPLRPTRGGELAERGYALYEAAGCGRADCGGGRCTRN